MKAIVQEAYGAAEVLALTEIERPTIGEEEVLVRVQAASVHIGDWHLMTGEPYLVRLMGVGVRAPTERVRGMDLAGTVEAVGARVTRFRPGDEVFGEGAGAFAEYARARAATLAPRPASLTLEEAAAVPTSACAALQALRAAGGPRAGERVLIVGASGGVGLFAVQIAKAYGAHVTGVGSTAKLDLIRAAGADRVIDYTRAAVTGDGQPYDLILDVGGNHPLGRLRRALTPRGTLVLVGGEGGGRWLGVVRRILGALLLAPVVRQRLRPIFSMVTAADLEVLTDLIEAGAVRPIIDRRYALSETPDAIRYLAGGQARGKLVITV